MGSAVRLNGKCTWFTAITAIGSYCRQKILEERPMRENMLAGPANVALTLAAAVAATGSIFC
jgi:hypothetical protein